MSNPSQKLGLVLADQTDPFSTADIRGNWEKIDAAPGSHICTSSTRPVWTAAQAGRKIIETDSRLEWMWDGTAFVRLAAVGLLKRSTGDWAIGERTTKFTTTSGTPIKVVSVTSVVVPAGNRPLRIDVVWNIAQNNTNAIGGYIYRSNTNNSGPREASWWLGTSPDVAWGGGGSYSAFVRNGLPAGTYDWSFQAASARGGESILDANAASTIAIAVTEL